MSAIITTAWLRMCAREKAPWVPLTPAQAAAVADELDAARSIADDAARSDIETMCDMVFDGIAVITPKDLRNCWYDSTKIVDPETIETVHTALRYLERRGLLKRHADKPHWVRPQASTDIGMPA